MYKFLKWTARSLGILLAVLFIAYTVIWLSTHRRISKHYSVEVKPIDLRPDSARLADGARLFVTKGCADCHGQDGAGKVFFEDVMIGRLTGANLTRGKGGLPAGFQDRDWLLALRHGLRPDGTPLLVMPSYEFAPLADDDIASIIAWCKTLPAVDRELPRIRIGPVGHILTALDELPLVPAERVDHQYQPPATVKKEASAAYGRYLAVSCTGCHHTDLQGGDNPVPGKVPVADITSRGHVGLWTANEFIATLRTGVTPEGKRLNNGDMPWQMTAQYTDEELAALYLYLKSL